METADQIHIANPIYDVVFRYMMEDNRVAMLFLSAILGKEVIELTFSPTEYSRRLGGETGITVIRMDFHARIREANGEERIVLIELQKAKLYQQIMRFRTYLGRQYQNPQNVDHAQQPLPIYPVYILGESFTQERIPVIRVSRGYTDAATGEQLKASHLFIEALSHDATVIQAEHLKGHRRTILERFLSIFDQSGRADDKGHILALNESDYPEQYSPVIRRLQKAVSNPKIEEDMDMEDEVLTEFQKKDEQIVAALAIAEREKERAEEQKQRAEEEKQRAEEAENRLRDLIRRLATTGLTVAGIADATGMQEAEILKILKMDT